LCITGVLAFLLQVGGGLLDAVGVGTVHVLLLLNHVIKLIFNQCHCPLDSVLSRCSSDLHHVFPMVGEKHDVTDKVGPPIHKVGVREGVERVAVDAVVMCAICKEPLLHCILQRVAGQWGCCPSN